jgi:uncharacterized protein
VQLIPRQVRPNLVDALADSRIACLLGPRQAGKSTLVRAVTADEHPARYVTLDDPATLALAREDPTGFVAGSERMAIDEVQRVPELLLALKVVVDNDQARGRFLITGSADIITHPRVADALPGRVEYLTLWPFSQAELAERPSAFLATVFDGDAPRVENAPVGRKAYADRVVRGGFPGVVEADAAGRTRFFAGYADSILGREVDELGSVRDSEAAGRVLRLAAARSAALANMTAIARELGIDHKTVGRHVRSLEQLFLVMRLPAWHANLGHRVVRSPKLHIADTGMLCSLIGVDDERLTVDGTLAGGIFETFAVAEIARQASCGDFVHDLRLHHYRDQAGHEVDLVLERYNGDIVAIEVKATASAQPRDAAGLRLLRDKLGDRFKQGILLYLGAGSIPIGDRISAVPLAALWNS